MEVIFCLFFTQVAFIGEARGEEEVRRKEERGEERRRRGERRGEERGWGRLPSDSPLGEEGGQDQKTKGREEETSK